MGLKLLSGKAGRPGQPRARASCDECGREEVFPCPSDAGGQARKKIQNRGWSLVSGRLRCPACEARRKVVTPMKSSTQAPTSATPAPPEPSREQKREIMDMLRDVYDIAAGRYARGETDATVADVLGFPQRPGWVAVLREEFFGPDGGNAEIEDLVQAVADARAQLSGLEGRRDALGRQVEALAAEIGKGRDTVQRLEAELSKIRQAVGPAARLRAGIR